MYSHFSRFSRFSRSSGNPVNTSYVHVACGGILGGQPSFPKAYSGLIRNLDLSFLCMDATAMSTPHITFFIASLSEITCVCKT